MLYRISFLRSAIISGNLILGCFSSQLLFLCTVSLSSSNAKAAAILWSNPDLAFILGNSASFVEMHSSYLGNFSKEETSSAFSDPKFAQLFSNESQADNRFIFEAITEYEFCCGYNNPYSVFFKMFPALHSLRLTLEVDSWLGLFVILPYPLQHRLFQRSPHRLTAEYLSE